MGDTDTDLHVQWAKLEAEFLELNLLADRNLQQQLETVRVAFVCRIALPDCFAGSDGAVS